MEKEFNPGRPPSALKENPSENDFREEVTGLEQAINATETRIAEFGTTPDLEIHLESLRQRLSATKDKLK